MAWLCDKRLASRASPCSILKGNRNMGLKQLEELRTKGSLDCFDN